MEKFFFSLRRNGHLLELFMMVRIRWRNVASEVHLMASLICLSYQHINRSAQVSIIMIMTNENKKVFILNHFSQHARVKKTYLAINTEKIIVTH
jgi:hypothetical protein